MALHIQTKSPEALSSDLVMISLHACMYTVQNSMPNLLNFLFKCDVMMVVVVCYCMMESCAIYDLLQVYKYSVYTFSIRRPGCAVCINWMI